MIGEETGSRRLARPKCYAGTGPSGCNKPILNRHSNAVGFGGCTKSAKQQRTTTMEGYCMEKTFAGGIGDSIFWDFNLLG
jgi:hypothetical protein